jgi:hypothetical protein
MFELIDEQDCDPTQSSCPSDHVIQIIIIYSTKEISWPILFLIDLTIFFLANSQDLF